ncbi:ATP-binding cassette domain-containing protein [Magnetococcus sp. PR-3]|uniref:ATP-binding cassette domain-containing protein n=1 Tax=Magnetococcus sp. PR-3 TaxID=3120355 RepID=UPI002FCE49C3
MTTPTQLILENVVIRPQQPPVNLTVDASSRIAIYGEEGVGKSQLLRLMAGLIVPSEGGEIRLNGTDLAQWRGPQRAQHLAVLFHQPERHFLTAYVGEEVGFGCQPALTDVTDTRLDPWLHMCGVEAHWWPLPLNQLSSAQRARVALLSVLWPQPPLLLADEPGAALSEVGEAELAEILQNRAGGLVVFTSRLSRAKAFATQIYRLDATGLQVWDETKA